MEQGGGADALALTLQLGAAGKLRVLQFLNAGEMPVDQDRIGERPQMLGGLELRRVGWQEEQMDVIGNPESQARMPASPIQDEDNLLVRACSCLPSKGSELYLEEGNTHAGRQMKDGAAEGGMDEAHEVAPGEAVAHHGERSLPNRRPDAAQQRFQADAMFVGRPQFDLRLGKGSGHLPQQWP